MRSRGRRFFLLIIIALAFSFVVAPIAQAATLSELLRQQSELRKQAEASKQKVEQKKRESTDLQNTIADIEDDTAATSKRISSAEQRINLTNTIIQGLESEIGENQRSLDDKTAKLKNAYVALYELSQTSTLERLAGSGSLADIISQQQYIQAIQDGLISDIEQTNRIKGELEGKKAENEKQKSYLVELNQDLTDSKQRLDSQRYEKTTLLARTQGEQARYQELLKKLAADQEKLDKQIYEARRKQSGNNKEQITTGGGNYPWAGESNPSAVDPWSFYKRQCVSYTAWRFYATYGKEFNNTRPGQGSAWNWPNLARDQGYQTSSTPLVGDVVSWPIGQNRPYGHTAWVIGVNGDGTINVAEYNWVVERGYSERRNVDPYRYGNPTYIRP